MKGQDLLLQQAHTAANGSISGERFFPLQDCHQAEWWTVRHQHESLETSLLLPVRSEPQSQPWEQLMNQYNKMVNSMALLRPLSPIHLVCGASHGYPAPRCSTGSTADVAGTLLLTAVFHKHVRQIPANIKIHLNELIHLLNEEH